MRAVIVVGRGDGRRAAMPDGTLLTPQSDIAAAIEACEADARQALANRDTIADAFRDVLET
ncbi:MAG TPA: hypothetical protein VMZ50_03875 [Phycisphaerae bacterium]|nr:hypothetical protein [Phycisphaerae bacterium]